MRLVTHAMPIASAVPTEEVMTVCPFQDELSALSQQDREGRNATYVLNMVEVECRNSVSSP